MKHLHLVPAQAKTQKHAALDSEPLVERIERSGRGRIIQLIEDKTAGGMTIDSLKKGLNGTESRIIDCLLEDRDMTIKHMAERLAKAEGTISSAMTSMRYKLAGGYERPLSGGQKRKSQKAENIIWKMKEKQIDGEAFDETYSRLDGLEKKVFDYYVASTMGFTQWEVAEMLGISKSKVCRVLDEIGKKLEQRGFQRQMPFL